MNQELAPANNNQAPAAFERMQLSAQTNHGAVAIESERAIAEAQGQLILAKKFPRSMAAATAELMDACKSPEFAASAFYSVPNRGSGPSIRFAEEVARVYGNFQYGHRELSRSEGKSEVEVYAWDMQQNNYSKRQITVLHVLDTKNGSRKLTDQADIDNRIANVASKQMRGRILALVPKHLVAAGIAECKKTIAGNNDEPISARVTRMTASFSKYGVNAEHLAKYIGHPLDAITLDELADLIGVFNAIKEGAKPSEYFGAVEAGDATGAGAAITNKARTAAGKLSGGGDKGNEGGAEKTPVKAAEKNSNKAQADSKEKKDPAAAAESKTQSAPQPADEPPPPPQTGDMQAPPADDDVF